MDIRSDVGLYGLSVHGRNLALGLLGEGLRISVLCGAAGAGGGTRAIDALSGRESVSLSADEGELVSGLARPRVLMATDATGDAMDDTIPRLAGLLDAGDVIVDCLEVPWREAERRASSCAARGIRYLGLAFVGGEADMDSPLAMMAGGDESAWRDVGPLLAGIAAKAADGSPCASFIGSAGACRFARMVHNSLAGTEAELVAEIYHLLRTTLRMSHDEMRTVFSEWNRTELSSYLLGVTADVLGVRDEDGEALVDKVLDSAGQDLAGLQAAEAALELGCPAGLFADAAFARNLSMRKDERVGASAILGSAKVAATGERQSMIEDLRKALLAARIISYSEGFLLLRNASDEYGWSLDLGRIARSWREGCFISASILDSIAEAFKKESGLVSILIDSRMKSSLDASLPALRKTTARAMEQGIPVPGFASAISFFDGYRSTWLPASLIAALRDRAASSGYERIDRPRGESFHSDWK